MAKLRHLAITVPDPEKAAEFYVKAFGLRRVGKTDRAGSRGREFVGVHHFGFIVDDVARTREAIEAAGGIAFDITANGWTGAAKD